MASFKDLYYKGKQRAKNILTAPKTFKNGDSFEVVNGSKTFTITIIDDKEAPHELKIKTISNGQEKESYTDTIELQQRLYNATSFKKLK